MSEIQDKIWLNFPCCKCVKSILIRSGYDNFYSLRCLNDAQLVEVEKYVEQKRSILENLSCEHANQYRTSTKFQFLPGHHASITNWCKALSQNQSKANDIEAFIAQNDAFSPLLRDLISSALSNYGKQKNSRRYSKNLIDFSIYMYIMSGRACYEILCANLPLLQAGSVRK